MHARVIQILTFLKVNRRKILLGSVAAFSVTILLAFTYSVSCGFRGCPSIAEIQAFVPSQGGRVLDRNGDLLGYLDPVRRLTIPLEKIPDQVRQAFIAVEDRRFTQHGGVDWRGVGRALWRDVSTFGVREGASTLTMQVARSGFLDAGPGDRSLGRKLIEFSLAPRIEKALSKDQILELYLNLIYLGDGTYGVEAASRHYFGKSVNKLSLSEGAMLAGLPRAPSVFDPRRHPDRALSRRNLVLALMAREKFISEDDASTAAKQRLRVAMEGWSPQQLASYAVEAVRDVVEAKVRGGDRLGEITVHTTFDVTAQRAAERAVRDRAAAIGRGVEGAMVALDPSSGDVLAMVGGVGPARGGFNRVFLAHRQPGSAFKPFVYAAALESGLTPATLVDDEPVELVDAGRVWRPNNSGDHYLGTITLRSALAHSANAATVRVSQHTGINRVVDMARRVGFSSPLNSLPSLALGSAEVTPMELVGGYAPFANGGSRVEPVFLVSIEVGGKTVYQAERTPPTRVLDSVTAFLVTSMLRSVVDEGTGYTIRSLGVYGPVAGKTGTTNNGADVWFVGYTPTILAGFWFGYDTPRSLGGGASGGRLAAPAWASFYRRGWESNEQDDDWEVPEGVVEERIDADNGLLAGEYCPNVRREYFREGTQPTEYCQTHDDWYDGSGGPIRINVRSAVRGLIDFFRGKRHEDR
ncbi:MAG: PBP1A family penicillin-binding protein [Gemmatimonadota bacterium]